jgi:hypothetical protein
MRCELCLRECPRSADHCDRCGARLATQRGSAERTPRALTPDWLEAVLTPPVDTRSGRPRATAA